MASRTLILKCYFCGKPLKSDNAHFEIFDQEQPPFTSEESERIRVNERGKKGTYGELTHPGCGEGNYKTVVLFAHTKCGPDSGYSFEFERLDESWDEHLQEKTWWAPVITAGLAKARAAMGIKRPPVPSWVDTGA